MPYFPPVSRRPTCAIPLPNKQSAEPNELWEAIRVGNLAKVTDMIENGGAELEQQNYFWFTPLLYAVTYNQKQIVEFLLRKGANINMQDKRGFSVLHQAAYKDNEELFQLLLQRGANASLLTLADEKPYQVAWGKHNKLKYANILGVPYESRWGETIEEAMEIYRKREQDRLQKERADRVTLQ